MSEHAHAAHVAHQFDSAEQQKQASMFGMWLFLLTEIMFFGAVFVAYAIYRRQDPFNGAFVVGSNLLDLTKGTVNTVILMLSSFTMTLACVAARANRQKQIQQWLIASILLGVVFLGIKATEYSAKFNHQLVPGANFHPQHAVHEMAGAANATVAKLAETVDAGKLEMYFGFYFAMTGLHALHMIIGIGILLFILRMARQGKFGPAYANPLEVTSLYWHFVDMVWIFLFPTLYLLGRHG